MKSETKPEAKPGIKLEEKPEVKSGVTLEDITNYLEEAKNLANDLTPGEWLTTTSFVNYFNDLKNRLHLNWEDFTKTKINYLRTQQILQPEQSGSGEHRTSWRYTPEDVHRAILIELLKSRKNLSVQESKVWLQSLEQNRAMLREREAQASSQETSVTASPTAVDLAYALLRNRVIGMLLTALSKDKIYVTPPECLIAIRALDHIPEARPVDAQSWEEVKARLQERWILAVSDAFSKLYIFPDYSEVEKRRPEIAARLSSYDWYSVVLQADENQYYEVLLGLTDSLHPSNVHIKETVATYDEPVLLHKKFPGLSTLLRAAFVHAIDKKSGTPLEILAEIIAEASNAWDYCGILLPEPDETEQAMLRVQESSTHFPETLRHKRVDVQQSLTGWSFRYRQISIVDSTAQNDPRIAFYEEEGYPGAATALPAVTEEQKVVGVIYVGRFPSNQSNREDGIIFTDELQASLKAFGRICADIIAREQVELETVRSLSQTITHPLVERFSSLAGLLEKVADEVSEGVSLEKATHSWIYLLTLNIQTAIQDKITTWLCQQGVETVSNFLAYRLGTVSQLHPLPVGYCKVKNNQYVYAILQTVDLPEDTYKKGIIRLQEELDQISIGRVAPVFYPSTVTFRFEELYQEFVDNGEEALIEGLKERTEERLIAGPYFNRGHEALYRADLDKAVSEFEDALRHVPQSWYGHKHLAEARMLQGTEKSIELAVKECHEAIKRNPNYASAHCLLADCLASQGKYGEALLEYEAAISLESTRSDFLIRYGLTLAGMTTSEYREAMKWLPQQDNRQGASGSFQPWEEAIDKFDRARIISLMYGDNASADREQRANYHYYRGYAHLQGGELDKAIEDFIVGRKWAPDDLRLKQAYTYTLNLRRKEKSRKM